MKMLTSVLAVLVLSMGWASAQNLLVAQPTTGSSATAHDVTGFVAPNTVGPGLSPESTKHFPNPHPDLRPKLGGVFTDGVKYGPVMISPTASADYGMGEKYLAAPSENYDVQHESGQAAHRPAGGLKLFSLEF